MNPFTSRKAVSTNTDFFGRGDEIATILERVGYNINLYGEPRIGKTSILQYLTDPLGAASNPTYRDSIGESYFAFLDVQRARNEKELWVLLTQELEAVLRHPASDGEPRPRSTGLEEDLFDIISNFESLVLSSDRRVVFILDNFDSITRFSSRDETLYVAGRLRSIWERFADKVSYLISTLDNLNLLFEKHELVQECSNLLHIIGHYQPIGLLDEQSSRDILEIPKKEPSQQSALNDNEVNLILKMAGRHPDLLKRTAFHFLEKKGAGVLHADTIVGELVNDLDISSLLKFIVDRMVDSDKRFLTQYMTSLREIAEGNQVLETANTAELLRLGLIERRSDGLRIFSELFRITLTGNDGKDQPAIGKIGKKEADSAFALDEKLSLTQAEARLFHHLITHRSQVCSADELSQAVWGPKAAPGNDMALHQVISRLRQKLTTSKSKAQIFNVRGQGYLLR